ncbi:glycerol kinase GlpK [Pelagibacterium lacus]|uniref:Glycerol kinase n=1 Tax=Pelagibacterium lacus TaxID=2282655 RepID=A0A369W2A6_9HYPH|nr:glycerol kinase GlpK [Pelagibacterium lacus]RDE08015.1 glycerol kinase [Pelagibacterium lacus]
MADHILAIDQGTTSSRAMIFNADQKVAGQGQKEFAQHFPNSGWVEHAPEDIWQSVDWAIRRALREAALQPADIAAIGITNQRETTLVWDRGTGAPIHNAIVWQDRRTAPICETLRAEGKEDLVTERTGLLLDPYFSGTKLKWLLDTVPGAREKAESGALAFGTVDSYLIWRLTGGRRHVTDATNASRTLMFNIIENDWDDDLLALFGIPRTLLPQVLDCDGDFGVTDAGVFGAEVPILGVAGDQHAAMLGQACFAPGMLKSTYGTGCFAVLNTGDTPVRSHNRLLTTIAYRLGGKSTYGLEGSIFIAGAGVQWLRDGLKIIGKASDSGRLASDADPNQAVYLVPAFVGLGAPYWDAEARGAIFGLTRNTGPEEFARAALEAVCYQTADLLDAMRGDWQGEAEATVLRVDGGMVASDYTMQFLADILDAPVDRPQMLETTVLGAAWLAGQAAGLWPGQERFAASWARERQFRPEMDAGTRNAKLAGWRDAVRRTLTGYADGIQARS